MEKWSDYRDVLEVESTGFPAGLGVACESERGVRAVKRKQRVGVH